MRIFSSLRSSLVSYSSPITHPLRLRRGLSIVQDMFDGALGQRASKDKTQGQQFPRYAVIILGYDLLHGHSSMWIGMVLLFC